MSYGILGAGQATKQQAMAGLEQAAKAEQQRNIANDNIEQQEKASDKSVMATGTTMGAMAGAQAASAAGLGAASMAASAAATGGIGLIAAWALTELL